MTAKIRADRSQRLHVTLSDQVVELRSIAKKVGDLGRQITETQLDILVFNILPHDVLAALGAPRLLELPELERHDVAHRLLPCWPSAPEILLGLEKFASVRADKIGSGTAPRSSGRVACRKFIQELGPNSKELFGSYMYATLATITNVTFPDADGGVDKAYVQKALKGYT